RVGEGELLQHDGVERGARQRERGVGRGAGRADAVRQRRVLQRYYMRLAEIAEGPVEHDVPALGAPGVEPHAEEVEEQLGRYRLERVGGERGRPGEIGRALAQLLRADEVLVAP